MSSAVGQLAEAKDSREKCVFPMPGESSVVDVASREIKWKHSVFPLQRSQRLSEHYHRRSVTLHASKMARPLLCF